MLGCVISRTAPAFAAPLAVFACLCVSALADENPWVAHLSDGDAFSNPLPLSDEFCSRAGGYAIGGPLPVVDVVGREPHFFGDCRGVEFGKAGENICSCLQGGRYNTAESLCEYNLASTPCPVRVPWSPNVGSFSLMLEQKQYLLPMEAFNCYGRVVAWQFQLNPARSMAVSFLLQIWRMHSNGYHLVASTSVSFYFTVGTSNTSLHFPLSTSQQLLFHPGDILGLFSPVSDAGISIENTLSTVPTELLVFEAVEGVTYVQPTSAKKVLRNVTLSFSAITGPLLNDEIECLRLVPPVIASGTTSITFSPTPVHTAVSGSETQSVAVIVSLGLIGLLFVTVFPSLLLAVIVLACCLVRSHQRKRQQSSRDQRIDPRTQPTYEAITSPNIRILPQAIPEVHPPDSSLEPTCVAAARPRLKFRPVGSSAPVYEDIPTPYKDIYVPNICGREDPAQLYSELERPSPQPGRDYVLGPASQPSGSSSLFSGDLMLEYDGHVQTSETLCYNKTPLNCVPKYPCGREDPAHIYAVLEGPSPQPCRAYFLGPSPLSNGAYSPGLAPQPGRAYSPGPGSQADGASSSFTDDLVLECYDDVPTSENLCYNKTLLDYVPTNPRGREDPAPLYAELEELRPWPGRDYFLGHSPQPSGSHSAGLIPQHSPGSNPQLGGVSSPFTDDLVLECDDDDVQHLEHLCKDKAQLDYVPMNPCGREYPAQLYAVLEGPSPQPCRDYFLGPSPQSNGTYSPEPISQPRGAYSPAPISQPRGAYSPAPNAQADGARSLLQDDLVLECGDDVQTSEQLCKDKTLLDYVPMNPCSREYPKQFYAVLEGPSPQPGRDYFLGPSPQSNGTSSPFTDDLVLECDDDDVQTLDHLCKDKTLLDYVPMNPCGREYPAQLYAVLEGPSPQPGRAYSPELSSLTGGASFPFTDDLVLECDDKVQTSESLCYAKTLLNGEHDRNSSKVSELPGSEASQDKVSVGETEDAEEREADGFTLSVEEENVQESESGSCKDPIRKMCELELDVTISDSNEDMFIAEKPATLSHVL